MATTKLTLIIAGGTSLGSYEAGALAEILYAVDFVNRTSTDRRFEIDVITGGSAGSITGALVARAILHDRPRMAHALYDVWVSGADISKFIAASSFNSLLTNRVQIDLARRHFGGADVPFDPAHAGSHALNPDQQSLSLAFSLSNMVGVDWGFKYASRPETGGSDAAEEYFLSTFLAEYAEFRFDKNDPVAATHYYDEVYWRKISDAVIASGTFPIAFPPYPLLRDQRDYDHPLPPPHNTFPAQFLFVDGGMFNNEPLRKAIRLSADQDGGIVADDRTFILVDPNLNGSKRDEKFVRQQSLIDIVKRLFGMLRWESQARDWLRADRVNTQVGWRRRLAEELGRVVDAVPAHELQARIDALEAEATEILRKKFEVRRRTPTPDALGEALEAGCRRIREYHTGPWAALEGVGADPDMAARKRRLFEVMMVVIDGVGGMSSKTEIRLHAIASTNALTAGDPWMGFLGFFNRTWREHDYRLGRRITHGLLPRLLNVEAYPREGGGGHNTRYDPEPGWGNLKDARPQDVDRNVKKALNRHVSRQIDTMMKQPPLKAGWFARQAIKIVARRLMRRLMKA